jgi:uncharacterized protein (DUF305 family)
MRSIMRPGDIRLATVLCALALAAACGGDKQPPATPGATNTTSGAAPRMLHAPGIADAFSQADVDFMTGMIPHHAQAVIMGGWAPTHGARSDVAILCERIVVGQTDEIKLMQTWLSDRGQMVPDAKSTRMRMVMNGETHDMLMPGMLTDEEMAQLDKARGPEFDRLFLVGMIKHHQGAIDMVDVLFKSYGGGQDTQIYKFASDVFADQSVEIDRMKQMLGNGGEPQS